jgi:hypothetical protein
MGQEAIVVRLNFVFFTGSVSELYGQRMYFILIIIIQYDYIRLTVHNSFLKFVSLAMSVYLSSQFVQTPN